MWQSVKCAIYWRILFFQKSFLWNQILNKVCSETIHWYKISPQNNKPSGYMCGTQAKIYLLYIFIFSCVRCNKKNQTKTCIHTAKLMLSSSVHGKSGKSWRNNFFCIKNRRLTLSLLAASHWFPVSFQIDLEIENKKRNQLNFSNFRWQQNQNYFHKILP